MADPIMLQLVRRLTKDVRRDDRANVATALRLLALGLRRPAELAEVLADEAQRLERDA